MVPKASDIFLNDDGTIGLVGVAIHLVNPSDPGPLDARPTVTLLGGVSFRDKVWVGPPPTTSGPSGGAILKAGSLPGASTTLGPPTVVSGLTRLAALRKLRTDPYPLYETLDALVEAVLELSRA